MNYQLLINIIQQVEKYESQLGELNNEFAFAEWLLQQKQQPSTIVFEKEVNIEESTESVISKYLIFLNRYAKMHMKKMLANKTINNFDDFSFLIYLFPNHSFTKMELIEKNVMEKTTGIEIINRLLKNELLQQAIDSSDKRSKRLTLTDKGKAALEQSFEQMNAIAHTISGDLNAFQKQTLLHLLHQLHEYHLPIYQHKS